MRVGASVATLLVFFLVATIVFVDAKLVKGKIKLSSETTEQYLSKYSFSVGKGTIEGNFSASGVYFDHFRHDLRIYLFSDVGIAKYNAMLKRGSLCRQRVAEASWSTKIAPERNAQNQFFSFTTEVNVAGRTHYWYALVADCWLEEYDAHPPEFQYTLVFLNDHGHIPADERGLLTLHLLLSLLMFVFGLHLGSHLLNDAKNAHSLHLVALLVFLAYVLQFLSIVCEFLHLLRYSSDGVGFRYPHTPLLPLDQLSTILQTVSEFTISFLLISVAFGWTLSSRSVSLESGGISSTPHFSHSASGPQSFMDTLSLSLTHPRYILSRVGPASLFFPVLAFATLSLAFWSHKYDDDFNQFHDFEHLPGLLTILLRALLCLLFLHGLARTSHTTTSPEISTFLTRLRTAGLVWFLSFPLLVLATFIFPPYARHQLVTLASLTLQVLALGTMVREIFFAGEYFRLSSLSHQKQSENRPVFDEFSAPVSQPAQSAVSSVAQLKKTKIAVD